MGSVNGSVTITAGQTYTQKGSDLSTPAGNIDITAKKVDIVEARETTNSQTQTRFEQSGITLSLESSVVQAAQTVQNMAEASSKTKNSRMQALAAASAALAAQQALSNPGPTFSASLGSSQSQSTTTSSSDTARGSTISAGRNTTIRATGDGTNSNITVRGSDISSGDTTTLVADNQVQLLAAANTSKQTSDQSSSSASAGMSLGSKTGVTLSASSGSGDGNGSDLYYTNTHVQGGKVVNIQSAGDTTVAGAVVKADTINATVGGNLNIQSLQDSSRYKESSQNTSGSATVGAGASGSVSVGATHINSNYQSVTEQSALRAGDGGFNVNVSGNTSLVGGAITSTDKAVQEGKNTFTTAKLDTRDIQNSASYSAESYQVTVGSNGGSAGAGQGSGSTASTTQSAISGIAGNKAARTGDAETGIQKIFDQSAVSKEINAQVAITSEFGQQASSAWGKHANEKLREAIEQGDQQSMDCWKADGACRIAGHAVIGGLGGGIDGALGAATGTYSAPKIAEAVKAAGLTGQAADALTTILSTTAGATIGGSAGGAAALNEVKNNYLTSKQINALVLELQSCKSKSCSTADEKAILARYVALSNANNVDLATCTTRACVKEHEQEIASVSSHDMDILRNIDGYEGNALRGMQTMTNAVQVANTRVTLYENEAKDFAVHTKTRCGGIVTEACLSNYRDFKTGTIRELQNLKEESREFWLSFADDNDQNFAKKFLAVTGMTLVELMPSNTAEIAMIAGPTVIKGARFTGGVIDDVFRLAPQELKGVQVSRGGNISTQKITTEGYELKLTEIEKSDLYTREWARNSAEVGNIGEAVIDDYFARSGYKVYNGKCGAQCFDGVYEKNGKIYINEVKPLSENGSIKLNSESVGKNGSKLDVQMSDAWIDSRVDVLKNGTPAQKELAEKIIKAIGEGRLVKVVTGVNSKGATMVRLK